MALEEMEKNHILRVLATTGGRVKGSGGAAQILQMNPSTLFSRMRKLGIKPPLGVISHTGCDISHDLPSGSSSSQGSDQYIFNNS
jgi:hypothetical protein